MTQTGRLPKSGDEDGDEFNLFDHEEEVIRQTNDMLRMLGEVADGVKMLASAYQRGYREQRRLVRLSDRMQSDLQMARDRLAEQAIDLASLNTQLKSEVEHRQRLADEMHRLAITDSLTSVFTRRYLFEIGTREIAERERQGNPLSLLVMDLDHFKQINDIHGHAAGDDALRVFARIGLRCLRGVDVFARIGGEEFAALLPGTQMDQAVEVAERIRAAVAEAPINARTGTINLTVSIGVAEFRDEDGTLDELLHRADEALYQAKHNGRDRVFVAGAEPKA